MISYTLYKSYWKSTENLSGVFRGWWLTPEKYNSLVEATSPNIRPQQRDNRPRFLRLPCQRGGHPTHWGHHFFLTNLKSSKNASAGNWETSPGTDKETGWLRCTRPRVCAVDLKLMEKGKLFLKFIKGKALAPPNYRVQTLPFSLSLVIPFFVLTSSFSSICLPHGEFRGNVRVWQTRALGGGIHTQSWSIRKVPLLDSWREISTI